MLGMVDDSTRMMLTHLNPRRFSLLLLAMGHAETFTAGELREISRSDASSLTRDLNALEAADLLVASPPAAERRQGQRTVYRVAEDAASRFRHLADLVSQASVTNSPPCESGPSANGTAADPE